MSRTKLTIYLMKPDTIEEDAINHKYRREFPLAPLRTGNCIAVLSDFYPYIFRENLSFIYEDIIELLHSRRFREIQWQNGSIALILRIFVNPNQSRVFCVTIGRGKKFLNDERIDRTFGLKASLNSLDHTKLHSTRLSSHGRIAFNSLVRSHIKSTIGPIYLNKYQSLLLRSLISGDILNFKVLGQILRYSGGLTLNLNLTLFSLEQRCRQVFETYVGTYYRDIFPIVDQITPVEPERVQELEGEIDASLNEDLRRSSDSVRFLFLAYPDFSDTEDAWEFTYSSYSQTMWPPEPELDLDFYLNLRRRTGLDNSMRAIKSDRILAISRHRQIGNSCSVHKALVAEIVHDNSIFQLYHGHWYEIDDSLAREVDAEISAIPNSKLNFPSHKYSEEERKYNRRAASDLDALLMDGHNIRFGPGRSTIEFCDIACMDRTLIHAKKMEKVGDLSHLWDQGTVSMEAFLKDAQFRRLVHSKIEFLNSAFCHIAEGTPSPKQLLVLYLLIGTQPGKPPWRSLTYFAKIALRQRIRTLNLLDVPFELAGVPTEPSEYSAHLGNTSAPSSKC